jgi:HEAT repeat protein
VHWLIIYYALDELLSLRDYINHKAPAVRLRSLQIISQIKLPGAMVHFVWYLVNSSILDDMSIDEIMENLQSDDSKVQQNSMTALANLAQYTVHTSVTNAIIASLQDGDHDVRQASAAALAHLAPFGTGLYL